MPKIVVLLRTIIFLLDKIEYLNFRHFSAF
jgi:hypothetical protein